MASQALYKECVRCVCKRFLMVAGGRDATTLRPPGPRPSPAMPWWGTVVIGRVVSRDRRRRSMLWDLMSVAVWCSVQRAGNTHGVQNCRVRTTIGVRLRRMHCASVSPAGAHTRPSTRLSEERENSMHAPSILSQLAHSATIPSRNASSVRSRAARRENRSAHQRLWPGTHNVPSKTGASCARHACTRSTVRGLSEETCRRRRVLSDSAEGGVGEAGGRKRSRRGSRARVRGWRAAAQVQLRLPPPLLASPPAPSRAALARLGVVRIVAASTNSVHRITMSVRPRSQDS